MPRQPINSSANGAPRLPVIRLKYMLLDINNSIDDNSSSMLWAICVAASIALVAAWYAGSLWIQHEVGKVT
jgi:hypothetical protein